MTNTTFTYYRRVYEVQFDAATQTGTLNWKDGMYDESVAFYKLNGAVMFRAKGKMANSVNKKMSSNKEAFLKARIEEVYESAEKTEVEEALLTPAETNMNEIEKLEKKLSQWWAVSSAALTAGNKESYEAAMEAIASIEKEIELAEEAIEQKAEGETITVTSRRKGVDELMKITLRAARVNKGLTIREVAELSGRNKNTIVDWESGKRKIPKEEFSELCQLYEIDEAFVKTPEKEKQND